MLNCRSELNGIAAMSDLSFQVIHSGGVVHCIFDLLTVDLSILNFVFWIPNQMIKQIMLTKVGHGIWAKKRHKKSIETARPKTKILLSKKCGQTMKTKQMKRINEKLKT